MMKSDIFQKNENTEEFRKIFKRKVSRKSYEYSRKYPHRLGNITKENRCQTFVKQGRGVM